MSSSVISAARRLREDVDILTEKHTLELRMCLDKWLDQQLLLREVQTPSLDSMQLPGNPESVSQHSNDPRHCRPPMEVANLHTLPDDDPPILQRSSYEDYDVIVPLSPQPAISDAPVSRSGKSGALKNAEAVGGFLGTIPTRDKDEELRASKEQMAIEMGHARKKTDGERFSLVGQTKPKKSGEGKDAESEPKKSNSVLPHFLQRSTKDGSDKDTDMGAVPRSETMNVQKTATQRKRHRLKQEHVTVSHTTYMTRFQRMVVSKELEVFSTLLILSNAVFIGWQVQYLAERNRDDASTTLPLSTVEPVYFFVIQTIFCFCFSIELGIRWAGDGLISFWYTPRDGWNREFGWNLVDALIVFFGVFDFIMEVVARVSQDDKNKAAGKVSVLRVLRVVRIVRVARVIRVMRFFRELRMMVYSIMGSFKSVFWVIIVLGMTFFIFGITFTTAVTDYLDTSEKWLAEDNQEMILYFGTLDRSVLSLFMSMSGGNDWGMYYDALVNLELLYRAAFLLFILFTVFAVTNVVMGVFVDSALQANTSDREIIVHEELNSRKEYIRQMKHIFEEMDDDERGTISLAEFEGKLSDERVIAYFNAMKLDVSEARVLFRLLDYDQSDEISMDEFLEGCYSFQGESRSLDMKIMQYEVRFLQEAFMNFQDMLKDVYDFQRKSF